MRPETRAQAPVVMPEAAERNCPRCGSSVSLYNGCMNCTYRDGGGIWMGTPQQHNYTEPTRSPVPISYLPDAVTGAGTFLAAGLTRGQ